MSVELLPGWKNSEIVQATASILAAQLATVVTADPSAGIDSDVVVEEQHAQG